MSDNKRKISTSQTEQTSGHSCLLAKNNEKNLRRRMAYHDMAAEKKTALLERRRVKYSARKHRIFENVPANHSVVTNSSPKSPLIITAQPTIFVRDKLSPASLNEQLTQWNIVYETGFLLQQCIPTFDNLGEASMSSQTGNSTEDIFDSSLNLEDTHYKEGYSEGYTDGLNSGKDEGNQVGLKKGFEVGEELGFYRGSIDVWNAAILVEPTCFSSRVQKNIKQMGELLCKYPFSDPENESTTDIIDSLRLKFRAICATLNIRLEYDGYPKASGIANSGF